jgi:hypothetical protein
MDNFIPGVWDAPIVAHFVRTSAVMDAMNEHRRRGHSEPEQSDKEWDRLRTERKLRYNKWRKLTDELIADGTLDHESCYECAGELGFNEDRPTRWVYDETEVEYRARIEAKRV